MTRITDLYIDEKSLRRAIMSCRNSTRLEPFNENDNQDFEDSLKRAIALAKTPEKSGEKNFLKGIEVGFNLIYPQYITKQLQRYHWFEYVNSSSMMHRITKMDFSKCCNDYVLEDTRTLMKELVQSYNYILGNDKIKTFGDYISYYLLQVQYSNEFIEKHKNLPATYVLFMFIISNCPMGAELFVEVRTNYLQLRTIYKQRKNHKLKEDYKAIIDMIESLPYAQEFLIN